MKKTIIKTAITALTYCSIGHAGNMGPVSAQMISSSIPFVNLEGSYTWNQSTAFILNNHYPDQVNQPWGGRLAGGFVHPFSERLRFSSEFGGGYYGSEKMNIPVLDWSSRRSIDGYDLLMGALYKIHQVDVFGQVGAMAQNYRVSISKDNAKIMPGGLLNGFTTMKHNVTQILPEIKTGAIYNLNNNWGISLAYMHVFGANMQGAFTKSATSGGITINGESNTQNPTLDSILFGLRYNIA